MATGVPPSASTPIPVVDFSQFQLGNVNQQQETARAIFHACHQVGFLYLKNHGIPQRAIDQAFDQSHLFFKLSLKEKQSLAWSSANSNCGYIGIERERLDQNKPGDLKEAFNICQENPSTNNSQHNTNQWPLEHPQFRHTISHFFDQCANVAEHIFRAFALALSMPKDYFVERHQTRNYTLRLLHYPPITDPPLAGQLRAGAHSDYGSLTLLFQNATDGLEIQTTIGDWIVAPTIPGTLLINTGDLMERWSNNVFRSTKHRVTIPSVNQKHRYSMAFFCQPDADTDIVCLPSCQTPQIPPKYPPIKSGDYLLSRLRATY